MEIQLHPKRLYELKKKLSVIYEGRLSLGADEDAIALHEGE